MDIKKRINELEKLKQLKIVEFEDTAKQCNFCGNYHGEIQKEIDAIIVEIEVLKNFVKEHKDALGQEGVK